MSFFYLYFCELYIIFSLLFFFYPHLPSHNCVVPLNAFLSHLSPPFPPPNFQVAPLPLASFLHLSKTLPSVSLLSSFFIFSFPSICLTLSSVIRSPIAPSTSSSVCPKEALATVDWLCSCWVGPFEPVFY